MNQVQYPRPHLPTKSLCLGLAQVASSLWLPPTPAPGPAPWTLEGTHFPSWGLSHPRQPSEELMVLLLGRWRNRSREGKHLPSSAPTCPHLPQAYPEPPSSALLVSKTLWPPRVPPPLPPPLPPLPLLFILTFDFEMLIDSQEVAKKSTERPRAPFPLLPSGVTSCVTVCNVKASSALSSCSNAPHPSSPTDHCPCCSHARYTLPTLIPPPFV